MSPLVGQVIRPWPRPRMSDRARRLGLGALLFAAAALGGLACAAVGWAAVLLAEVGR